MESLAEFIRKDASLKGVTSPGSRSLQVKASLYMDDVAVFRLDPPSVRRLMSICDQFKLASGTKAWPIPRTCAYAVTQAYFHFIWRSKMGHVHRDTMYKPLDKVGKNIPNVILILMATFVSGCIKLCVDPRLENTKCHCTEVLLVPGVAKDGPGLVAMEHSKVLKTLREKETVNPVTWFPEQTAEFGRMPHYQNFPTSTKALLGW
eukprot:g28565.t1